MQSCKKHFEESFIMQFYVIMQVGMQEYGFKDANEENLY